MRALLGHNPSTAGGLMNPDFVIGSGSATAAEALAQVRAPATWGPSRSSTVCVVDEPESCSARCRWSSWSGPSGPEGLRADRDIHRRASALEAEVPEVARLMSDYNLIAMPVVDGEGRPVGIIAVDDVLELLVPEEWRRRAGVARD